MIPTIKSSKGVSRSGVQLFNRALVQGYQPSRTSCGPAQFLRAKRDQRKQRATA